MKQWALHKVAAITATMVVVTLCLTMVLGVASGCAARNVTVGGVVVEDDPGFVKTVNRIYNVETGMIIAMEVAVIARERGLVPDDTWDRIADLSNSANSALSEARGVLLEYRQLKDKGTSTRLQLALTVLDETAAALIRLATTYKTPPILGTLVPQGG